MENTTYKYIKSFLCALCVVVAFAVLNCHPYFNTLYNAEEAFTIAQREHKKIMAAYPDSIVVTPPDQSIAMYDRAIDKSLKMLEVFPRNQKRHDRAHFLMGRSSFYKKEFETTISRISDLHSLFPESPLLPPARVYAAKAHIMVGHLNIAEDILLELLKDHPRLDRNHEITMLLVEIALLRGGRSQALGLLEGLSRSNLPFERRLDIILRMADLQYELGQYDNALALLRGAPRSNRFPQHMYRLDRQIYFCYAVTDQLETALSHLTAMQRNRRYASRRNEILFYRAVTLRRLERYDEAIAVLEGIRYSCGQGNLSSTAASICGRALYELAHLYQQVGDLARAELIFEEASKHATLPPDMHAHRRLMALRKLRELRKGDSLGQISFESRYMIAELFLFDFESPDSAYTYFLELAGDMTKEDSLRPRALLSAAVLARHEFDFKETADSLCEIVIADYYMTEYARLAQIEMDIPVTIMTESELAQREYRDAESLLETDPTSAVRAFYNLFLSRPESEIAARSLHAAAWSTDNVLHRNRAAMALYEELCEVFPQSSYCLTSALPRLTAARDSLARRQGVSGDADSTSSEN